MGYRVQTRGASAKCRGTGEPGDPGQGAGVQGCDPTDPGSVAEAPPEPSLPLLPHRARTTATVYVQPPPLAPVPPPVPTAPAPSRSHSRSFGEKLGRSAARLSRLSCAPASSPLAPSPTEPRGRRGKGRRTVPFFAPHLTRLPHWLARPRHSDLSSSLLPAPTRHGASLFSSIT